MKKKRIRKRKIALAVAILVVVGILVYFIFELINLLIKPTNIVTVENGKISSEISAEGYIIRDEQVLKGENYKNGISQIKAEGEKVSKGENVFRYYTANEENLNTKIKELDDKISEAQAEETSFFSSDLKIIENEIETKINEMYLLNDVQKIQGYKSDIDALIKKKTKIIGELSPSGSYLKKLIEQRSSYESELNSGSEYMKAPVSGMVSYKVDGLEETLNSESIETISEDTLNKLNFKTGQIISSSNESGKIVNNFYCYIVTCIKKENAQKLKEGNKIKIRLINGNEVPAEVSKINEQGNNKSTVAFKITKGVEDLIEYRKINFDIIYWSYSGLKVPNSSIMEENGLSYVMRNRAGYKDKILVKVKKQNEMYSIVDDYTVDELKEMGWTTSEIVNKKSIGVYDEILVDPQE